MRQFLTDLWARAKERPFVTTVIVGGSLLAGILVPAFVFYILPMLSLNSAAELLLGFTVTVASYVISGVIVGAINSYLQYGEGSTNTSTDTIDKNYFEQTVLPKLYLDVEKIVKTANDHFKQDLLRSLERRMKEQSPNASSVTSGDDATLLPKRSSLPL